jgi:UDP-N-acetylenolpyruvoylglucosamine reductase
MAALIAHIQERVDEAHGIRLHPEVMRLGRFGTGS